MKKVLTVLTAIAFLAVTADAQVIPDRKREPFSPGKPHGMMKNHQPGMAFHNLNLTDAQKEQVKKENENFRKEMKELRENENLTIKEWKSRMETLRKGHQSKMESVLTTDQKAQIEKMKMEQKAIHEVDAKARMEKMKIRLGLSDEQAAKMDKNRKETGEKLRKIREDKGISADKKREAMKELAEKQKEFMKSILTEDQLKKMKQGRKPGSGHGQPGKPAKKEII